MQLMMRRCHIVCCSSLRHPLLSFVAMTFAGVLTHACPAALPPQFLHPPRLPAVSSLPPLSPLGNMFSCPLGTSVV